MAAPGSGLVVVVLLFAVVAPLLLYYFVRRERTQWETMDRQSAEHTARRDTTERDDPR